MCCGSRHWVKRYQRKAFSVEYRGKHLKIQGQHVAHHVHWHSGMVITYCKSLKSKGQWHLIRSKPKYYIWCISNEFYWNKKGHFQIGLIQETTFSQTQMNHFILTHFDAGISVNRETKSAATFLGMWGLSMPPRVSGHVLLILFSLLSPSLSCLLFSLNTYA